MTEKVLLGDLATYLKEIAPEVWTIFLRQQYYWGMTSIVGVVFSCALLIWGLSVLRREPKWAVDSINSNVGGVIITVVGAVLIFVSLAIFLTDGIHRLFNPVYFVIKELIP